MSALIDGHLFGSSLPLVGHLWHVLVVKRFEKGMVSKRRLTMLVTLGLYLIVWKFVLEVCKFVSAVNSE